MGSESRASVTQILLDDSTLPVGERLLPIVYDELRRLAGSMLRSERSGHTLSATDIVHEAYFKLFDQTKLTYKDRSHFFGAAANAMRRILIDHARRKMADKRIPIKKMVPMDLTVEPFAAPETEIIALDDALTRLSDLDERQAKVVELRYFGGFSETEISEILDVSRMTVSRDWRAAKLWLHREITT